MKIEPENEAPKKNGNVPALKPNEEVARKHLLARVAGDIASGIVSEPSESSMTAAGVAEISVDIAEEILKKAGL
jgi:hypothetical protein